MKGLKKNTYTYKVLQWLQGGRAITSKQAIEEFGCTRLAHVIYRLRYEFGLNIKATDIPVKNRNGMTVMVAKYELVTEQ